jgi:hypothetical protein
MLDLKILCRTHLVFEDAVNSVSFDGLDSDFELLSFHMDVFGALRKGDIVIDNRLKVPIEYGIVSMIRNKCLVIVEPQVKVFTESRKKRKTV